MITIQILVVAVAVAAVLMGVIVHVVDKKHSASEVARLNAEITERKEEGDQLKAKLAKNEEENLQLKKQLEEANQYASGKHKIIRGPVLVDERCEGISNNVEFVAAKGVKGKKIMLPNENINGTDNQDMYVKCGEKVLAFQWEGEFDGKSFAPSQVEE